MYHDLVRRNDSQHMKAKVKFGVEYLVFPQLEQTGIVNHLFTTRLGGVSEGIYSSMNLSYTRGDSSDAVDENYRRIAAVLNTQVSRFVCSDQTHTTNIRMVSQTDCGKGVIKLKDYHDIDGLITNEKNIVLSTFYADCVPLYFVDPVNKAIGLSHSGWKGTVNRMAQATIRAMSDAYHSKPEDMVAAIGPSICKDCYEVGEEVAQEFLYAFPKHRDEIVYKSSLPGKYQLDLWRANYIQLVQAGIREENIAITDLCTCCNPDYLFSHRASKGKRGNMGAFLMLNR